MIIPKNPRYSRSMIAARDFIIKQDIRWLPIDPFEIAKKNNWKLFGVGELAKKHSLSRDYIIKNLIGSEDGKAFYYADIDQYTIVYNEKVYSEHRIRWTLMHEIGHIVLGHLKDFEKASICRNGLDENEYSVLEKEADTFASEILAPPVILNKIGAFNPGEIRSVCELSRAAAINRSNYLAIWRDKGTVHPSEIQLMKQFSLYLEPITVCCKPSKLIISSSIKQNNGRQTMSNKHPFVKTDSNGKFKACPKCGNEDFSPNAQYCKLCGLYLYNHCGEHDEYSNNPCGERNPADARYCEQCGSETYLSHKGLLMSWKEVIKEFDSIQAGSECEMFGMYPWEQAEQAKEEVAVGTEDDELPF